MHHLTNQLTKESEHEKHAIYYNECIRAAPHQFITEGGEITCLNLARSLLISSVNV